MIIVLSVKRCTTWEQLHSSTIVLSIKVVLVICANCEKVKSRGVVGAAGVLRELIITTTVVLKDKSNIVINFNEGEDSE